MHLKTSWIHPKWGMKRLGDGTALLKASCSHGFWNKSYSWHFCIIGKVLFLNLKNWIRHLDDIFVALWRILFSSVNSQSSLDPEPAVQCCWVFFVVFVTLHCFFFYLFNWRIVALQNFVVFCQTSTWISHRYIYIPSLLNLPPHPTPPGWYRAPARVSWAIQCIPTGYLFYIQ